MWKKTNISKVEENCSCPKFEEIDETSHLMLMGVYFGIIMLKANIKTCIKILI